MESNLALVKDVKDKVLEHIIVDHIEAEVETLDKTKTNSQEVTAVNDRTDAL